MNLKEIAGVASRPWYTLDEHRWYSDVRLLTLGQGLVEWWRDQGAPAETRLILRDSAFADDVVKTNLTAILAQGGLTNVRSL